MNWYFMTLKKYAVFGGRAPRLEYWLFMLFNAIFGALLILIDVITGTYDMDTSFGILSATYTFTVIFPGVAVSVRRLHDIGKSGLWFLITAVPVLGLIVFLWFMALDSQPGTNKYGPSPKG